MYPASEMMRRNSPSLCGLRTPAGRRRFLHQDAAHVIGAELQAHLANFIPGVSQLDWM